MNATNATPILSALLILLFGCSLAKVQSEIPASVLDFYEAQSLLLKHKPTVESILGMKKFALSSTKERAESTLYTYRNTRDTTQILVRIRKADRLVSEVAWSEKSSTIAYLTHNAVRDGFVPVNGNSRYYNRFKKMGILVGWQYSTDDTIPCIIRAGK